MSTIKKSKHIFASVGSRFPMDRLMISLDSVIEQNLNICVKAQIGKSTFTSTRIKTAQQTSTKEFEEAVKSCDVFVSHAGMGNILLAAQFNKPLIIMPRQANLNEHINNHQIGTAEAFANRPLISVVHTAKELELAILRAINIKASDNSSQINIESRTQLIKSIKAFIDHDE